MNKEMETLDLYIYGKKVDEQKLVINDIKKYVKMARDVREFKRRVILPLVNFLPDSVKLEELFDIENDTIGEIFLALYDYYGFKNVMELADKIKGASRRYTNKEMDMIVRYLDKKNRERGLR